jgi:hypothetical protein
MLIALALVASLLLSAAGPVAAAPSSVAHAAKKAPKKAKKRRPTKRDLDGDGIPNLRDRDVDGDGIPNAKDRDVDGDRVPNGRDRDADGDGVPNARDRDVDGDGTPNAKDPDVDGDGVANARDRDVDGDGVKNVKDPDMDGDGLPNKRDPDMDGDGVPNTKDEDQDGDGRPYGVGVGTAPLVGISDQRPATFSDPLFTALGLRTARLIIPWNAVWTDPERLGRWLDGARAAGLDPLVSFEHGADDACPAAPCYSPSVAEYSAAFQAFRAAYPWVTTISPWNEANHQSQPTGANPRLAAEYYNAVLANCVGCTIVAADVLDSPNMEGYLKAFRAAAKGEPKVWGLHNYSDSNRFRTTGTDTMLQAVPGEVWLTETGGVVEFTTTAGVAALPYDEARATAAMTFLFDKLVTPNSSRIRRVYVYQWRKSNAADRFDAGVVSWDGRARGSYGVLRQRLGR